MNVPTPPDHRRGLSSVNLQKPAVLARVWTPEAHFHIEKNGTELTLHSTKNHVKARGSTCTYYSVVVASGNKYASHCMMGLLPTTL